MEEPKEELSLVGYFEKLIIEHGSSRVQEKWNNVLKEKIDHLEKENFALKSKLTAANARLQEKEKNSFGHLPTYIDTVDFDHFSRFGRCKGGLTVSEFAKDTDQRESDAKAAIEEYLDWGAIDSVEKDGEKIYKMNAFGMAYLRHLDGIFYPPN